MAYKTDVKFKLEFSIKNIFSLREDGFARCRIKIRDFSDYDGIMPKEIDAIGVFNNVFEGDIYEAQAMFTEHEKYGYGIKILGYPKIVVPNTAKELAKFIKKHNKGLSQETCNNAVDKLGVDIISRVAEDITLLDGLMNFTEKKKKNFYEFCVRNVYFEDLLMFLQTLKIPAKTAYKIYENFGRSSLHRIKTNPYFLYTTDMIDFRTADKIAYEYGSIKWDEPKRLVCAVRSYVDHRANTNGDVCVKANEIINDLNNYIKVYGQYPLDSLNEKDEPSSKGFDNETIAGAINYLVAQKEFVRYETETERYLFKKSYYQIETELAKQIKERLKPGRSKTFISKQNTLDYLKTNKYDLSDEQKGAIVEACRNKISILTGGPGTGKTFTVNLVTKTIKHFYPDVKILLLAPTGRAASHMKEVSKIDAFTIHSALKITPGSSGTVSGEEYINDCDFVIMDEASMTDEWLFNMFFKRISKDASVLIVGDSDQLPSVSAGNVLHDMIASGKITVTALTKIYRQAGVSKIVLNSHRIKNNKVNEIEFDEFNGFRNEFACIKTNKEQECADLIVNEFERAVKSCGNFEDVIILSPVKKGVIGVNELNSVIQAKMNPKKQGRMEYKNGLKILREGDRVLQNKNNYEIGVVNGALGTIVAIYQTDQTNIDVLIDGYENTITYSENDLADLSLGYCITVHKSQGSEIDHVIMPLYDSQYYMINKKILYTAITRAKETFLAVGNPDLLRKGIEKEDSNLRYSLLSEMLQKEVVK